MDHPETSKKLDRIAYLLVANLIVMAIGAGGLVILGGRPSTQGARQNDGPNLISDPPRSVPAQRLITPLAQTLSCYPSLPVMRMIGEVARVESRPR